MTRELVKESNDMNMIPSASLRERLGSAALSSSTSTTPSAPTRVTTGGPPPRAAAVRGGPIDNRAYHQLKARIHEALLDRIDLESMQRLNGDQIRQELRLLVERLLEEEMVVINDAERKMLTRDIQNEMLGFGPLEPLLEDPTVSDILVNTHKQVYVERRGKLELTDVTFTDEAHLMKIIDKIVSRVGRRVDESSPMVDARLELVVGAVVDRPAAHGANARRRGAGGHARRAARARAGAGAGTGAAAKRGAAETFAQRGGRDHVHVVGLLNQFTGHTSVLRRLNRRAITPAAACGAASPVWLRAIVIKAALSGLSGARRVIGTP